ncbi:MAG TPA: fibronectin type III domain-containing protein [bacterium]|nr:fibronectin type III domain-containing protein [bacterium]
MNSLQQCVPTPGVGFVILVVIGLIFLGCGERERINPFDPAGTLNPDVFRLTVKSSPDEVILEWDPIASPDLTGFNIYRAVAPEPLQPYDQLPADSTNYTDNDDIEPGQTYVYGISALGETDETQLSSLDTISTGNSWWWVLSEGRGPLSQLSHDGLHVYQSYYQYSSPRFIAADRNDQLVFLYDFAGGSIYYQWENGSTRKLADGFFSVRDMLYNETYGHIILLPENDTVVNFVYIQGGRSQLAQITHTALITAGAVSPNGINWIAAEDSLFYIQGGGIQLYYTTDGAPITAVEPVRGDTVFVGLETVSEVRRIVADPARTGRGRLDTTFTGIGTPEQIVHNRTDQSTWIHTVRNQSHELYRLSAGGMQRMLTGLEQVLDMDVNPVSNVCLIADYRTGAVYRVSPDGTVSRKESLAGWIYAIAAQPIKD